jgi:hypothetical protein
VNSQKRYAISAHPLENFYHNSENTITLSSAYILLVFEKYLVQTSINAIFSEVLELFSFPSRKCLKVGRPLCLISSFVTYLFTTAINNGLLQM